MTDKTRTISIRLKIKDYERLKEHLTRENLERLAEQLYSGEITIIPKGMENIDFKRVNTKSESVNTNEIADCEECPYKSDLNMSGFDEVCDYKGIDRQKALDKCVQMLWR